MIHRIKVIAWLGLLGFTVALIGCNDAESQQARARAEAAEAKLQKAAAQQQAVEAERDELKTEVGGLSQSVQDLTSKLSVAANLKDQVSSLSALMTERDSSIAKLKEQTQSLTKARDTAIAKLATAQATIDGLTSQVEEQVQKFSQLDEQNKKLQAMIDDLKKNLGGEIKLPGIPNLR